MIRLLSVLMIFSSMPLWSATLDERSIAFAAKASFDKDDTAGLYDQFMCAKFKEQISREEFSLALEKDRTYPYITPFCIYFESYEMADDGMSAEVVFVRAARLPGNYFRADAVFENEDWYFYAFEEIVTGEYLDKFNRLNYSLSWYYDTDNLYRTSEKGE